jgi:hypothetical protein
MHTPSGGVQIPQLELQHTVPSEQVLGPQAKLPSETHTGFCASSSQRLPVGHRAVLYYIFSGGYEQAELYSAEEVKTLPNGGVRTSDLMEVRGRVLDANGTMQEIDSKASAGVEEGRQGLTVPMATDSDSEPRDVVANLALAAPDSPCAGYQSPPPQDHSVFLDAQDLIG